MRQRLQSCNISDDGNQQQLHEESEQRNQQQQKPRKSKKQQKEEQMEEQQHEPQQQQREALIFNGLINEKTMIEEPSPVSDAYNRLCPSYDPSLAAEAYQQNKQYVTRICQELYYKVRANNYRINYEAPFMAAFAHDSVWEGDSIEIYLPIRLPIGHHLQFHPEEAPGFVGIKIPIAKRKPQLQQQNQQQHHHHNHQQHQQQLIVEKDPLEFLKSSKRYVSSLVSLKSTWKLVNNAMQQISANYGNDFIIQDLSLNKDENSIDITAAVSSRYLNTRISSPKNVNADEEFGNEDDEVAAAVFGINDSANHDQADHDYENQEEDDKNATKQQQSALLTNAPGAALNQPSSRNKRNKVDEVTTKILKLRVTPTIQDPNDEHAYLTPRKHSFLNRVNQDLWSVQYPLEEAMLIDSLTQADRGLRVRAWRGLTDFCAAQSELRCISRDMLKHTIFHLAESEVDLVGIRWQRAPLIHYISDLLASVRDHLRTKSLPHFFFKDINILQCLQQHQMRSAALKIDFYLRKDSALVRAVQRTIDSRETQANEYVSSSGNAVVV